MTDFTADERDVRALESRYDEAWSAGDVARLVSFFVPGAVIVTPYGDVWTGVREIEEGLRAVMAQPSRDRHASTITAVHFVTGDVAVVDGQAVLDAAVEPVRNEAEALAHSFTDVVVKRDGHWRIAHVRAYGFIG
jgi:uncharacterized protein (TIGR02246 family)